MQRYCIVQKLYTLSCYCTALADTENCTFCQVMSKDCSTSRQISIARTAIVVTFFCCVSSSMLLVTALTCAGQTTLFARWKM